MEKSIKQKIITGAIALTCTFTMIAPTQAIAGPCDAEEAAQATACKNEGSPECNAAAEARTNCLRANASSSDSDSDSNSNSNSDSND